MDDDVEGEALRLEIEAWKKIHKLATEAIELREIEQRAKWLKDAAARLDEQAQPKWFRRLKKLLRLGSNQA